jgi:hypothetical protein
MQVKCLYQPKIWVESLRQIDGIVKDKDEQWSAILNTFSSGRGISIGFPESRMASELFIVGGRSSIIDWLRIQGPEPVIYAETGAKLHVYILRKQRLLDKNLTTLLVSPQDQDTVARQLKSSSWDLKFDGTSHLPSTTPAELANFVERGLVETRN